MKTTTARLTQLAVERLDVREVPAFLGPVASMGGGVALAAGDFNHDGRDDVAAVGGTETVSPWSGLFSVVINGKASVSLSNGDGTFQAPIALAGAKGHYLDYCKVRDVNGDGHPDVELVSFRQHVDTVKVEEGSGSTGEGPPTVRYFATAYDNVWLGKGDGTFGKVTTKTWHNVGLTSWPPVRDSGFAFVDLSGDGIPDQAYLDRASSVVRVWIANGDGTYQ